MLEFAERQWIRQAQGGNATAFAELVHVYQNPVYHLTYRLLGARHEAEDATQETFLRAFAHLASYQTDKPFRTWLLSIAAHVCIDQLRHEGALRVITLGAFELGSDTQDPETLALSRERAQELRALLRTLPAQSRELLLMRYWDELSYREMGEATGLPESAVKSRLHRARHQLARIAEHYDSTLAQQGQAIAGAD